MDHDDAFTSKQAVLIEKAIREYTKYLKSKQEYFKAISENHADNMNLTHAFLTALCLDTYNEILLLMVENIDDRDIIACINKAENGTMKKLHGITLIYLNNIIDDNKKNKNQK